MDTLLRVYREQLGSWGGYLTDRGLVDVPRLERLLRTMGDMEEDVFALRAAEAAKFEKKKRRFDRRGAPAAAAVAETDEDEAATGDELTPEQLEAARQATADADMLAAVASRLALEGAACAAGDAGAVEQPPAAVPGDDGGVVDNGGVVDSGTGGDAGGGGSGHPAGESRLVG